MIKTRNEKTGLPMYVIYPGEHYATGENCLLNTVTGSCIVVCLFDKRLRIGGIGHFIVPGMIGTEGIISSEIAEFGIVNLEYIMAEIVKLGGDRKQLSAKIFGAGYTSGVSAAVVRSNVAFLHEYFSVEKIPVEKEDLGGNMRREILFNPYSGDIYRRILKNNEGQSEFVSLEREYIDKAFRGSEIKSNYVLFD
jgi:chemotaxis protein CheD